MALGLYFRLQVLLVALIAALAVIGAVWVAGGTLHWSVLVLLQVAYFLGLGLRSAGEALIGVKVSAGKQVSARK